MLPSLSVFVWILGFFLLALCLGLLSSSRFKGGRGGGRFGAGWCWTPDKIAGGSTLISSSARIGWNGELGNLPLVQQRLFCSSKKFSSSWRTAVRKRRCWTRNWSWLHLAWVLFAFMTLSMFSCCLAMRAAHRGAKGVNLPVESGGPKFKKKIWGKNTSY